ncbi:phosphatidylserine decarboxylase [Hydrogenimonas cancrithermarum]|uniref:Phosphatidylserine decarboxylase n=1 Tax=Hydrogenimonas cancrithermarum TaxID=2993563 RepID=A0ABM8FM70_9BACT|nr:phosphatidylserine decarboxylase [Hydrogenimonas cancrithermarum]BDY13474.1 hypothetical protein HCR_17860 [Hydrogenimonas cancrithermarum]
MGANGTFLANGWRTILPVWGATLVVLVFSDEVLFNLLLIGISAYVAFLFYLPERNPFDISSKALISPVDGTIETVETKKSETVVTIRKSLWDVSVVRAPVSGEVTECETVHGMFLGVDEEKAKVLNEHGVIRYDWEGRRVEISMRCGFFSYALPLYAKKGAAKVAEVQALLTEGLVEVKVPASVKIEALPGDRVLGGYSVLGRDNR